MKIKKIAPQEIAEYAKNHTVKECAQYYGCSYCCMWNYLVDNSIDVKRGQWIRRNRERDLEIFQMSNQYTLTHIAHIYGMSRQRVSQIVLKGVSEKWPTKA